VGLGIILGDKYNLWQHSGGLGPPFFSFFYIFVLDLEWRAPPLLAPLLELQPASKRPQATQQRLATTKHPVNRCLRGFFFILMHSGNKTATPALHIYSAHKWPHQRPQRPPTTLTPPHAPCRLWFTGRFYSQHIWQHNCETGTRRIRNGCKLPMNTSAHSTPPPTPLPLMWKPLNVLPCLGNVVCWR
jgi:hypothetical protein